MASFIIATDARTSLATKVNDDLDGGKLQLYSGSSPGPDEDATGTKLAEFTLPAKGNNTVANGVLTFGSIDQVLGLANGDAGYFRLVKSDDSSYADGDVNVAGAAFIINTVTIVLDGPVAVVSGVITMPAGV